MTQSISYLLVTIMSWYELLIICAISHNRIEVKLFFMSLASGVTMGLGGMSADSVVMSGADTVLDLSVIFSSSL